MTENNISLKLTTVNEVMVSKDIHRKMFSFITLFCYHCHHVASMGHSVALVWSSQSHSSMGLLVGGQGCPELDFIGSLQV